MSTEDRPICGWCAKPLAKSVIYIPIERNWRRKSITWGNDGRPVVVDGRHVKQITRTYRHAVTGEPYAFNVWLGDWGYDGSGAFHAGGCAQAFGHWAARKLATGELIYKPKKEKP